MACSLCFASIHSIIFFTKQENEEALKREISEFLHDNVLLDILSMKMLVSKSEKPAVKELMTDTLEVLDNGMGFDTKNRNDRLHKGLVSVYDTVYSLEGSMKLNSEIGQGTEIIITMQMKGKRSYESFISR